MSSTDTSPSYKRRQALREADSANTIRVLDSYPLTKYFEIAERLLDAFQSSVDRRELDEAYVYGLRFAGFGVESLPKHKDWRRAICRKQKARNAKQVDKVISMMEIIKQRMDVEETILQERRRIQLEEEKKHQMHQLNDERRRMEEARQNELKKVAQQQPSIEQSAMAKLQAMQTQLFKKKQNSKPTENNPKDIDLSYLETKTKPSQFQESKQDLSVSTGQETREQSNMEATKPANVEEMESSHISNSKTSKHSIATASATLLDKESEGSQPVEPMTPRSSKEQATIDLLQRTIRAQEKRLDEIETVQIPDLLKSAKLYLRSTNEDRKSALKCLARKRSLEHQLDIIKAAIFNMETQMFMLENSLEDRQVQKAIKEASEAMEALQQSVGNDTSNVDLADLAASLPQNMPIEQDDEELLEELQEWLSLESSSMKAKRGTLEFSDEDLSILSLPVLPASTSVLDSNPRPNRQESFRQLLKVVLN